MKKKQNVTHDGPFNSSPFPSLQLWWLLLPQDLPQYSVLSHSPSQHLCKVCSKCNTTTSWPLLCQHSFLWLCSLFHCCLHGSYGLQQFKVHVFGRVDEGKVKWGRGRGLLYLAPCPLSKCGSLVSLELPHESILEDVFPWIYVFLGQAVQSHLFSNWIIRISLIFASLFARSLLVSLALFPKKWFFTIYSIFCGLSRVCPLAFFNSMAISIVVFSLARTKREEGKKKGGYH